MGVDGRLTGLVLFIVSSGLSWAIKKISVAVSFLPTQTRWVPYLDMLLGHQNFNFLCDAKDSCHTHHGIILLFNRAFEIPAPDFP